jgi:hypothetical protein
MRAEFLQGTNPIDHLVDPLIFSSILGGVQTERLHLKTGQGYVLLKSGKGEAI